MDQKHQTAIKELEQKILELTMLQCSFKRTRDQFDSTQKKIEVLQKDLENLKKRLNKTTIIRLSPLLDDPLFFITETRKGRVLKKKKKFELGNEEIEDSKTGFYEFNDPDLGICTNIYCLGEKMRDLMNENQEETQRDQPIVRKRLIKWIQDCDDSDKKLEALQSIKSKAINLGTKLSHMLVDFMFSVSMNAKQLAQKFRYCLGCIEGDDSLALIISRISMLLEMTVEELSQMNTKSVEETFAKIEENEIDRIILELVLEIIRLRHIIEHEGLPESRFPKREILTLPEDGIKQCKEKLEEMESENIGFDHVSLEDSDNSQSQSQSHMVDTSSCDAVNSKIYRMWKGFWSSEDV